MGLLILFALLQAADAYSTLRFLKHGVNEANPLLAYLFKLANPVVILVMVKLTAIAVLYLTMGSPYWSEVVIGLCVLYTVVVIRNLKAVK